MVLPNMFNPHIHVGQIRAGGRPGLSAHRLQPGKDLNCRALQLCGREMGRVHGTWEVQ